MMWLPALLLGIMALVGHSEQGCSGEYEFGINYRDDNLETLEDSGSPQECQTSCQANTTCLGWVWVLTTRMCQLKSRMFKPKTARNTVSGKRDACPMSTGGPVDGGWSDWEGWSVCGQDCQRTRTRACDQPTPKLGGSFCSEEYMQKEACSGTYCPGQCSVLQTSSPTTQLSDEDHPWRGNIVMGDLHLCADGWDLLAAQVACAQLGLGRPLEVTGPGRFPAPKFPVYRNTTPVCSGTEDSLEKCQQRKTPEPCSSGPAGVVCSRVLHGDSGIKLDGQLVCVKDFMDLEAIAVCRQLGYGSGEASAGSTVVTDGVTLNCPTGLLDTCSTSPCTAGQSVDLNCSNPLQVQLVGSNQPGKGSVLYEGDPVCDDNWDIKDAEVVCRELGYTGALSATVKATFGPVETVLEQLQNLTRPYSLNNVNCSGKEAHLANCSIVEGFSTSQCIIGKEVAGVECRMEQAAHRVRRMKRGVAAAVVAAAPEIMKTGASIIGSALEYFDKKEQRHQDYLKERPDSPDLRSAGVEIKLKTDKGYIDEGGEYKQGNYDLVISEPNTPVQKQKGGEEAYTYPAGLGPMLMNGCFGSGYQPGDPCYASKRLSEKCLNMLEAANYVGVGFDATGEYNHNSRRKSMVQRMCKNKGSYQGEDVPDTMNVFGIYDTSCTGKSFQSLDARSAAQRKDSKIGENTDFLNYQGSNHRSMHSKAKSGLFFTKPSLEVNVHQTSQSTKQTVTKASSRATGEANQKRSTERTGVFEFTCRIRRYEIFLDEVTPDQLSTSFLEDYMSLPIRYFDFRQQAPQRYASFLERWGTHYIKSASFGGKFSLIRESTYTAEETETEFSARMHSSTSAMFESRTSSSNMNSKAKGGFGLGGLEGTVSGNTNSENSQNQETSGSAEESSSQNTSQEKSTESYSIDDILVEGGSQNVASILADKNRAGFKAEFKDWLESIPKYPKGYDFKFGELSDLLNINFKSLLSGGFDPCWTRNDLYDGDDCERCLYNVTTKDGEGDAKTEVRSCSFKNLNDFQDIMDKRRLSLKRAINIYGKNGGRSGNELLIPGGEKDCEFKDISVNKISYKNLIDGDIYKVNFDLEKPIGRKIAASSTFLFAFKEANRTDSIRTGRWMVNPGGGNRSPGQLGSKVTADENGQDVLIFGAKFSYESGDDGNFLQWTTEDCEDNKRRFGNLHEVDCDDTVDWVNTPLAEITSLAQTEEFVPCNVDWSNNQMLMSDNSCVRFAAASEGPIYFILSAVPKRKDTWYYFRISEDTVTVYKGFDKLDYETDAVGAVGLGSSKIFQSYMICSEYENTGVETTTLTFGKIAADETFSKNAKLNSYLIVRDDGLKDEDPIQPSFFAFGSGTIGDVQIVDLELTDVPGVACAGDTLLVRGECMQSCPVLDIAKESRETVTLNCIRKDGTAYPDDRDKIVVGEVCSARCPANTHPYPATTTCQKDSKWSSNLNCLSTCDPLVVKEGIFTKNGSVSDETLQPATTAYNCQHDSIEDFEVNGNILEGTKCTYSASGLCGKDTAGFQYFTSVKELTCTSGGVWWGSGSDGDQEVTDRVCSAQPCEEFTVAMATTLDCPDAIQGFHNEKDTCTLSECETHYVPQVPSTVQCQEGEWRYVKTQTPVVETLQCIPANMTCAKEDLPTALNVAGMQCNASMLVAGTSNTYLGGTVCKIQCNQGYYQVPHGEATIQCRGGAWSVPSDCDMTSGVLITGGIGGGGDATTEVYLPSSNTSCPLGYLPDSRHAHTQTTMADNSVVICGSHKSCLKFSPTSSSSSSVWTEYATMVYGRLYSTSWLSSEGLIIIAGQGDIESDTTTEKVPGGGLQFSLGKKYSGACAIADQNTDSVILTGGYHTPVNADRYNLQGHVESMPDIQERKYHACGSYMSGGNMVLLVSGGQGSIGVYLSSTEKLVIGHSAWSETAELPRALYGMPSINFNNQVMILGGRDLVNSLFRTEILTFNSETSRWTVTGHMQTARSSHGASLVRVPANICG